MKQLKNIIENTHKHNNLNKEFTQHSWATSPGLAFSGDLSIMSSKVEFLQKWAQSDSHITYTKQQGFTGIPQVFLSTQILLIDSLSMFTLYLNTVCLCLLSSMVLMPIGAVCSFLLLGLSSS